MEPNMWGPIYWSFLFSTVLGYPLEPGIDVQSAYYRFFRLLEWVLPCGVCKANYAEHFRNIPLNFYLYSRKALMEWVLILHNEVNRSIGKPPLTLEQAIQKYLGPKFINCSPYQECVKMPGRSSQIGGNDVKIGTVDYSTRAEQNKAVKPKSRTVAVEGFVGDQVNPSRSNWNWILMALVSAVLIYWLCRTYMKK